MSQYDYIEVQRVLFESDSSSYTLLGRIHQNGAIGNTEIHISTRDLTQVIQKLNKKQVFSPKSITSKTSCPEFTLIEMDFRKLPFNTTISGVDFGEQTMQVRA